MSLVDEYIHDAIDDKQVDKKKKVKSAKKVVESNDIEEKRESLCILAVLGTINEYTGVDMSLGDVKRLKSADVEKYYNRYQIVMGNKVTNGLVDTALQGASEIISLCNRRQKRTAQGSTK